jgi:hypothetical protein
MIRLTQLFLAACVGYLYGFSYGVVFLVLSLILAWLLFAAGKGAFGEETISSGYLPMVMRLINWGLCFAIVVFVLHGHPMLESVNHTVTAMVPDLESLAIGGPQ